MKVTSIVSALFLMVGVSSGTMMGGFKDVDVSDEQVVAVTKFGMEQLSAKETKYSGADYTITEASRQVVAGLNYNVVVRTEVESCEDITLRIWDHFGEKKLMSSSVSGC